MMNHKQAVEKMRFMDRFLGGDFKGWEFLQILYGSANQIPIPRIGKYSSRVWDLYLRSSTDWHLVNWYNQATQLRKIPNDQSQTRTSENAFSGKRYWGRSKGYSILFYTGLGNWGKTLDKVIPLGFYICMLNLGETFRIKNYRLGHRSNQRQESDLIFMFSQRPKLG